MFTPDERAALRVMALSKDQNATPEDVVKVLQALGLTESAKSAIRKQAIACPDGKLAELIKLGKRRQA